MRDVVRSIGVWGDSVLKGVVQDGVTRKYSVQSGAGIGASAKNLGIQLINRSRFGFTVSRGREALVKDLSRGIACEVAILEYGGNDCDFDWAAIAQNPTASHLPNTLLEDFVSELRELVELLRERAIEPILTSLPPLDAQRYFRHISEPGVSADTIERWLGDVGFIYRWHEMYSNAIVRLSREMGTALLDVRSAFLAEPSCDDLICEDGIHPSAQGQSLIGRVFADLARRWFLA
jgi:lysophospholipase L1-like esterase